MSFLTPIALPTVLTAAAVIAALAVVAYILKMRRRRFEVPFSTLWQRVLRERETTSLFKRLRRLLSLLLQLAVLALLIVAILDPRLGEDDRDARSVVIIVDASASMKAVDERPGGSINRAPTPDSDEAGASAGDDSAAAAEGDGASSDDSADRDDDADSDDDEARIPRIEAAKARARELLDSMGGGDMAMVVRMDGQTTPLSRFDSDMALLKRTVAGIQATDTPADLARALRAAADALRGRPNPMIVVIGDGAYPDAVLERIALGDPGANDPSASDQTNAAQDGARSDGDTADTADTDADADADANSDRDAARPDGAATSQRLDAIDLRGIALHFVPVGQDDQNVGIVAFNARRYLTDKTSYAVFVEVQNFGDEPAARRLIVYSGDNPIDVKTVVLKPGERLRQLYPNLGGGEDNRLRAELKPLDDSATATAEPGEAPTPPGAAADDATAAGDDNTAPAADASAANAARRGDVFALDDRAFALLPARKRQRVLLVTLDNLYLEGAMLVYDSIQVDKLTPEEYEQALGSDLLSEYSAVVFDDYTPAELPPPPTHLIYFGPTGEHSPFPIREIIPAPRVTDVDDSHPVMRWVILDDVNYDQSAVFQLDRAAGEVALGSYVRAPIIAAKRAGQQKIVAFGFSLGGTDLTLRVAFPLLLVNALDWFAGDDADLITTYQTGRRFRVPLDGVYDINEVDVALPSGRRTRAPVSDGHASFYGHTIGVHRLSARREGGQALATIELAANLANPAESDIAPNAALRVGDAVLTPPPGFRVTVRRSLWLYLVLAVLAILAVEWITYHRRITV
ncbi:MAG: hypothetical protein Tsb0020_37250 [Haliangiales bacterium]